MNIYALIVIGTTIFFTGSCLGRAEERAKSAGRKRFNNEHAWALIWSVTTLGLIALMMAMN